MPEISKWRVRAGHGERSGGVEQSADVVGGQRGSQVLGAGDDGVEQVPLALLQRHLTLKGQTVSVTGNFGPETTKALDAFQKLHRIEQSGHTSYATWARLLG